MEKDFEIKTFVIFEEVSLILEGPVMTLNVFFLKEKTL